MSFFELRLAAKSGLIPTVEASIVSLCEGLKFSPETSLALGKAVAAAAQNAIAHGFGNADTGEVAIEVRRDGEQIVFAVKDEGLAFDPELLGQTERGGVGSHLMHEVADELRVRNLGPLGMCVEIVKHLPVPSESQAEPMTGDAQVSHEGLELRRLSPEDAVALTRCAYRTYGHTYAEEIYYPDMVAQGIQAGYLLSYGIVDPQGEVVSSLSVLLDEPDAPVGELSIGMTDPRYRGHGYFEQLLEPVVEAARQQRMLGLFAETVTIHTITQKGKHKHGWRETGVELGYIKNRDFKAFEGNQADARQTILLFFTKINPSAAQLVYAPEVHRDMIGRIYAENGLERSFGEGAPAAGIGQLDVQLQPQRSIANLVVNSWGEDTLQHVAAQLKSLRLQKVEVVHLDLPLAQPATAWGYAALHEMGFFFAGVIPNLWGTDVLRLQYLNNVGVYPAQIQVYSEFGKELLAYVLQQSDPTLACG